MQVGQRILAVSLLAGGALALSATALGQNAPPQPYAAVQRPAYVRNSTRRAGCSAPAAGANGPISARR